MLTQLAKPWMLLLIPMALRIEICWKLRSFSKKKKKETYIIKKTFSYVAIIFFLSFKNITTMIEAGFVDVIAPGEALDAGIETDVVDLAG